MLEVKDIVLLLTKGLDQYTIDIMSDEIESAVIYINNLSKIIQFCDLDEINLLKSELVDREAILVKKVLDDEVVGLEFRIIAILNDLINERLCARVRLIY